MKKMLLTVCLIAMAGGFVYAQGNNGVGKEKKIETTEGWEEIEKNHTSTSITLTAKEKTKRRRVVREDKELKFLNEAGRIKKSLPLGIANEEVKVPDRNNKNKRFTVRKKAWNQVRVSDSGEKALIYSNVEADMDEDAINKLKDDESPDLTVTDERKVRLMDADGNVVWEKEMPKGISPQNDDTLLLSSNGTSAILTSDRDGENDRLYVFNTRGEIILELPTKEQLSQYEVCWFGSEFKLSDDGKYLGITSVCPGKGYSLFFYNLENGKWIDLKRTYAIYRIDKNGKAYLFSGSEKSIIDLKKELGN